MGVCLWASLAGHPLNAQAPATPVAAAASAPEAAATSVVVAPSAPAVLALPAQRLHYQALSSQLLDPSLATLTTTANHAIRTRPGM